MSLKINKILEWMLYLLVFITPFSIAGTNLISGLVFLIWIVNMIIVRDISFIKEMLNKLLLIFTSFILLSSTWAYNSILVFDDFIGHVLPFVAVFFTIITIIKEEIQIKKLIFLFLLSNIINSLYSLYLSTKIYRVEAFTHSPNRLADILLMLIIISVSIILFEKNIRWRLIGLITLIPGLGGIIVTYSRGGWISLISGLFAVFLLYNRKVLIIFMILVLIIPLFMPEKVFNRVKSITDLNESSNNRRILIWKSGLNIFKDHPILGIGWHNVKQVYKEYKLHSSDTIYVQLHNIYLNILVELGIIGFLIFISLIFHISRTTFLLLKKRKTSIIIAFMGIFIAMLVHGLIDVTIRSIQVGILFTYFSGIVYTINRYGLFENNRGVF